MEVYRATTTDLIELAKLFNEYRIFYKQASDLEGAQTLLSERFQNKESIIFVVVDNGEYLGFTQLYPSFSSVSMKRLWILNDLFVSESARKRGVAQLLLNAAKNYANETNAKALNLQTANDNLAAQALYEKNGYELEKTFRSYSLNVNKF